MDHRRGGTAAPDEPYDAIRAGSIDGTDPEPHDHAILRALNAKCTEPPPPICSSFCSYWC